MQQSIILNHANLVFLFYFFQWIRFCVFYTIKCVIFMPPPPLASPAMGHWGTCPPRLSTAQFSRHFRAAQTLTFDYVCLLSVYPVKITLLVSCPSSHQILATPLSASDRYRRKHCFRIVRPSVSACVRPSARQCIWACPKRFASTISYKPMDLLSCYFHQTLTDDVVQVTDELISD